MSVPAKVNWLAYTRMNMRISLVIALRRRQLLPRCLHRRCPGHCALTEPRDHDRNPHVGASPGTPPFPCRGTGWCGRRYPARLNILSAEQWRPVVPAASLAWPFWQIRHEKDPAEAAIMGLAYVQLQEATGGARFLQAEDQGVPRVPRGQPGQSAMPHPGAPPPSRVHLKETESAARNSA